MRKVFSLFFLFSIHLACAQIREVENFYDQEKKILKERYTIINSNPPVIEGVYSSFYSNGNLKAKGSYEKNIPNGLWQYYYENGKLKMTGELVENKRNGLWKFYFENANPQMEGILEDGNRQGFWKYYYENGKVKSEGKFIDNKKDSLWRYYYEDGSLKAEANFKQDKGIYKEYYASGKPKMEGLLVEDRSDSTWRYYYEDGILKATGPEKDGIKNGFWQYFHSNGKLLGEGNYENGATTGVWKYYDEMGKLSATGVETSGEKEGTWKLYYPSGAYKGEGTFTKGEGPYKEFYESGKLRAEGFIKDGKNHGSWKYYTEDDGRQEGIAEFVAGEGDYTGYYKDGKVKIQGKLKDDKRIGIWTLYKPDGEVAGYYQAFYENNNFEFKPTEPPTRSSSTSRRQNLPYEKPPIRIKKQKSRYFKPAVNEFRTVILSANPLALATGSFPVSLEYYFRERIGYELKYTVYRNPFFKANSSIDLNTLFRGGFSADLRQKFYQPDGRLGMLYFAHEVRFTYLDHQANILEYKNSIAVGRTLHAPETLYEYSVLVGNRWMRSPGQRGITFDIFGGIGIGYRNYRQKWESSPELDEIFEDVKKNKLTIPIRIGASIGYAF